MGIQSLNEPKKRPDTRAIDGSSLPCIDVRSVSLTGVFILASAWFLHEAQAVAVPLTVALLLHFLLIPVVRRLKRYRIPEPVGAAVALLSMAGGLAIAGVQLADPAAEWLEKAPRAVRAIEAKLLPVKESMAQISQATEAVDRASESGGAGSVGKVEVVPNWRAAVFGMSGRVLGGIGATLLLLYFLLASGDLFVEKLMNVLPHRQDRKRAIDIVAGVERQLSRYLFQTIVIQTGLGVALWPALWALGMPNPGLWAAAAAVLQIIPYIGGAAVLTLIAVVAAVTFDHLWAVAAPPLAYVAVTTLKGFLAPVLLGRRLVLNPVAVLVSLVFFGWMWGLAGTLLAVPLLASFKILCDHIEGLGPTGEFLAR